MTDFSVVCAKKKDSHFVCLSSHTPLFICSARSIYFCVTFCNFRHTKKPNGIRYLYFKMCIGCCCCGVCVWSQSTFFFFLSTMSNKTQFTRRCINVRWTIKWSRRWELNINYQFGRNRWMKIPNRCSIDKFFEWNSLGVENKNNKKKSTNHAGECFSIVNWIRS